MKQQQALEDFAVSGSGIYLSRQAWLCQGMQMVLFFYFLHDGQISDCR